MVYRQKIAWISLAIFTISISQQALALRCPQGLISQGDSASQVLAACGKPQRQWRQFAPHHSSALLRIVWEYDWGPQQFRYRLTFKHGHVIAIKSLGYGRLKPPTKFMH